MPAYIAMLRGINVSGHKPVKMDRLRAMFEALGFGAVKTYIQSGNVVFTAASGSTDGLAAKIAAAILAEFGFEVPVLVRSAAELAAVLKRNPLLGQKGIDETKLHVTFLADTAPKQATADLKSFAAQLEQFVVQGQEIYLYCPDGYGQTKLSNTLIEKKLGIQATTRNWRTVNVLLEMTRS